MARRELGGCGREAWSGREVSDQIKVLVTGGPVPIHIDDMRVLSNSAKGGQSAEYADIFAKKGHRVTYLTTKFAAIPKSKKVSMIYHNGFDDYREKVKRLAKQSDLVILSAAVANYMRKGGAYKGKMNPNATGELILTLVPTPKVIGEVKKANPECCLVGFKLMSRASDKQLIDGAWRVMMNSRADVVVANDKDNLMRKLILAKDKSVREAKSLGEVADFIEEIAKDRHFRTKVVSKSLSEYRSVIERGTRLAKANRKKFIPWSDETDRRFGCIAVISKRGMIVSPREKDAPTHKWAWVAVTKVDPARATISTIGGKASLNSSLLWSVFRKNPSAAYIIHYHKRRKGLPTVAWAPPGTLREYRLARKGSFNIDGHGVIEIYDKLGNLLV